MKQMTYENAIELEGLSKSFDDFQLKDISFALPRGTIMGLIGENGAGKTTTIKLLLSLLRPDSGTIRLFDRPLNGDDPYLRSCIGSVLDQGFFYEELTPKQMANVLRRCHPHWDDRYFAQLLDRFGLSVGKRCKDMSRGMKAKLKLTLAMAPHPQLLLLDEPTSGLDPVARSEFLDLLQEFMQDENCSILLSSHITSDLERIADYITYIHQGRLLFSEETTSLLENYAVYRCGWEDFQQLSACQYAGYRKNAFGCDVLIQNRDSFTQEHPDAVLDPASLEDIMTLHAQRPQ